jgi:hypothetical protein
MDKIKCGMLSRIRSGGEKSLELTVTVRLLLFYQFFIGKKIERIFRSKKRKKKHEEMKIVCTRNCTMNFMCDLFKSFFG